MRAVSWRFFGGAAILASGLLLKLGAPIFTVAAGVLLAAVLNWSIAPRARK